MNLYTTTLCRIAIACSVLLAGCASMPPDEQPLAQRDAASAGIEHADALPRGAWPDASWWKRYNDVQLDALIERALKDAPSMATAEARVRLATRTADAARAQLGLSVDLNASLAREKLSHYGLIPPPFGGKTIYDAEAGFGLSYDFDWWGKNHAALAAALDEDRAADADRVAASLLLATSVAREYFSWQAAQARIGLAQTMLDHREQFVKVLQARLERGLEAQASIDQARSQLDAVRQTLALLRMNQSLVREQLRSLLGAAPGTLDDLAPVALPDDVAGIPAQLGLDLLARRPDVEAGRLRVESNVHRIDSAKAQFYPDISISALAGLSSVVMSKVFNADSLTAGVTPALHLPIFDAGRLRANLGVSRANLDIAIAAYNQSVIDAASEVAVQASTLTGVAAQKDAALQTLHDDEAVTANTAARVRQGLADARDSIGAEIPLLQQRDVLAQLDAQRVDSQIALIKALGGGYRADPAGPALSDSH